MDSSAKRPGEDGLDQGHQNKQPKLESVCCLCNVLKHQGLFSKNQWSKSEGARKCKECLSTPQGQAKSYAMSRKLCFGCNTDKKISDFNDLEQQKEKDAKCKTCVVMEREEVHRRKLAEPRKCVKCGELKSKEHYSKHQWDPSSYEADQQCLVCLPIEEEEAEMEKQRVEDEKKEYNRLEENWKRDKKKILREAKLGSTCYAFIPSRNQGKTVPPKIEDLEGNYEIFFRCGYACDVQESRTTRGTLTFSRDLDDKNKVVGHITFDKSLPACSACSDPTYDIALCVDEPSGTSGALVFKVENLEDPNEFINPAGEEIFAYLSVFSGRVACPWIPTDEHDMRDLDEMEGMFEQEYNDFKLPTFRSIEEAEALVQKEKSLKSEKSWICNHMDLRKEIAEKIHEYISWKPPPVLFFEPGDLYLATLWAHDHGGAAASFVVARKVVEEC